MGHWTNKAGVQAKYPLLLALAVTAAFSYAQSPFVGLSQVGANKTVKIPAGKTFNAKSGGAVNTYSFFPQIDNSIQQRGFRPTPGGSNRVIPNGLPNGLVPGGLGAKAVANQGSLFPGIQFTGLIPPDCHAAVGTTHVVQVVNSNIAFYDKTNGTQTFAQSSSTFFSGLGAPSFQFDPRVVYDQYNDRFILIFLALDTGNSISQILIATSDDGNPNGTWNRFVINSAVNINGTNSWLDYPMVGYTGDAFVVSGNMFPFGAGGFTGIQSFVIDTSDMYSNVAPAVVPFTSTGLGFNLQPADTYTPGTNRVYGISLNTSTSVRLWAFTALDTATPALTSTTLAVASYGGIGAAPSGTSPGAMDTIAGRTMDAASRGQTLVAAHTVGVGGRAAVRWYEINMGNWPVSGTPNVIQHGNISLPTGQWAFMPAISKNADDAISVMYTRSSSSIVSDLVVSSRLSTDPLGTMGAPVLLQSGVNPNAGGRWGDYFSVTVDPSDDLTFWGHGEVTRADGLWTTEITSWVVSGPSTQTEYDPTGVSLFYGTPVSGGLAQVLDPDNTYFDILSQLVPGLGYFAGVQADFTIVEAAADVEAIKVSVEASATLSTSVTGTVYLWNWNTSQFEYVNAFVISGSDVSNSTELVTNLTKYVGPGGAVRAAFRGHDPFRRAGNRSQQFTFKVDYIHLTITSAP